MEVQKEAQRIMTLSVWKMYHSRMQRGGLRLHRSLQLSLVMRSARELYLSAKLDAQEPGPDPRLHPPRPSPETEAPDGAPEPMETTPAENPAARDPPARANRKRRSSSSLSDAGLVPSKKARLEEEVQEEAAAAGGVGAEPPERLQPPAAPPTEGAFPNLARVLQRRFSGLLQRGPAAPPTAPPPEPAPACRPPDGVLSVLVRAVVAF